MRSCIALSLVQVVLPLFNQRHSRTEEPVLGIRYFRIPTKFIPFSQTPGQGTDGGGYMKKGVSLKKVF